MRMTDDELANVKVDDRVIFGNGQVEYIGKVTRLTNTMIAVRLNEHVEYRFNRQSARQVGGDKWHSYTLQTSNAEAIAELRQQQRADKLRSTFRQYQWGKVSLDQLELIYQILNPKPEG